MSQNQDATKKAPVLEIAWRRYAELDYNADQAQKKHRSLRIAVISLSVAATLLAILNELLIGTVLPADQLASQILRISLISVPIAGSIVLAFANRFQQGERWLALRAGAEEINRNVSSIANLANAAFEHAGGTLRTSEETTDVGYFPRADIENMDMSGFNRQRVDDAFAAQAAAFVRDDYTL